LDSKDRTVGPRRVGSVARPRRRGEPGARIAGRIERLELQLVRRERDQLTDLGRRARRLFDLLDLLAVQIQAIATHRAIVGGGRPGHDQRRGRRQRHTQRGTTLPRGRGGVGACDQAYGPGGYGNELNTH
jgi:hypothetical protein